MIALWIYIGLLLAGGLMGFVKARSKISLYMAIGFGVALSLCAAGWLPPPVADGLLIVLLLVFLQRWIKTKKLAPAGLMFAITLLVLALRLAAALVRPSSQAASPAPVGVWGKGAMGRSMPNKARWLQFQHKSPGFLPARQRESSGPRRTHG